LNGVEHDYEDAQSLEALREFVDTKLSPQCNPIKDETSCSERGLQFGKKWISKSSLSSDGDAIIHFSLNRSNNLSRAIVCGGSNHKVCPTDTTIPLNSINLK
jgi:hypothetical protein